MATEAGIINVAMFQIHYDKRIASRTEGTKAANAADEIYDETRDELLEMHKWNFAAWRAQCAEDSTTPATEWDHQYVLPSDFVRLTQVADNTDMLGRVEYQLEGGKILTDATKCYIKYVRRVTDPNLMTPTFRAAFSKLLASRLAVVLSNSSALSEAKYKEFLDQDLPTAKSVDALQDQPERLPESDWVTARTGDDIDRVIDPAEPSV